jgi:hypothetical protein
LINLDWQKSCQTNSDWSEFYREHEHAINEQIKSLMLAAGGQLPEDEMDAEVVQSVLEA